MMPLYGNPGDYAWGRGGFDAIVTQLLNQMDGTGPPPMSTDDIKLIPTIKVNQTQVGEFQRRHTVGFGTIQVLRQHMFGFFRPTHLCQHE